MGEQAAAGAVTRFGGHVAKNLGDGLLIYFGWPTAREDDPERGVRAGLAIVDAMAPLNATLDGGTRLAVRIGLHTGTATVGNMGSTTRFNYTMLGDAANLASRLEGINKYFHTYFMASSAVMERLGGAYPARELSRVAVVGRREPVTVFEPMLPEQFENRRQTLEVFNRGLREFYAGKFAEAQAIFSGIAAEDPPAGHQLGQVCPVRLDSDHVFLRAGAGFGGRRQMLACP